MTEMKKSFCRSCHVFCGIEVEVADNRVVSVRGDVDNPLTGGFTCARGRNLPELHHGPERLHSSMKRTPDGAFETVDSERAMDEIAARLTEIVDRHGPRAVALYSGTSGYINPTTMPVSRAWLAGLGSPSYYTSLTIDQPAKSIAPSRHGSFMSGGHSFETSDVWMLVGVNPLVSMYSVCGFPMWSPSKRLRDAQQRGLKLIVVDPRRTETARRADIHLQVKPGEDPTLLAGMLRVILDEELYDADFCAAYVQGMDELREAVRDFTLDYVETRTGVPAALVEQAARLFAQGPRGMVGSGTGANMTPHANLTEHLVSTLRTVCGRYNRAGDTVSNPGVLTRPRRSIEQAVAPSEGSRGAGERSRIRGLQGAAGEMPTAALSDEILEPGDGQVRALISVGSNPVASWPDQAKTIRAIEALELNVTVDVRMSSTARLADYVIASALPLERADATLLFNAMLPEPYAQYTPPIVTAPPGVIEEWEFFWGLARRMGTSIELAGEALDLDTKPTTDELLDRLTTGSRVPLDEVRAYPGGHVWSDPPQTVAAGDPGSDGRLHVAPVTIVAEMNDVRSEPLVAGAGYRPGERFTHRLISRRMAGAWNSWSHDLATHTYNPAFMNPADLDELGIASGQVVEIASDHGSIPGVVEAAADVPSGVISMVHMWGEAPGGDRDVREIGSNTNRLIDNARDYDPISGIPRMSAIPVNVRPVGRPD